MCDEEPEDDAISSLQLSVSSQKDPLLLWIPLSLELLPRPAEHREDLECVQKVE